MRQAVWFVLFGAVYWFVSDAVPENHYATALLAFVAIVMLALCVAIIRGIWNVVSDLWPNRRQSADDGSPPRIDVVPRHKLVRQIPPPKT